MRLDRVQVLSMVAINPMRGKRNTPLLSQLSLTFNTFSPHWVDINEDESIVNTKRLKVWREKDAKSDS